MTSTVEHSPPSEHAGPLHPSLSALSVVLLVLLLAVVAGGSWLLSAAESTTLVDSAVEWRVTSPLRAVVQLLCLNYNFATLNPGDVKMMILGVGAGLAALVVAVALLARSTAEDVRLPGSTSPTQSGGWRSLVQSAQVLALTYVGWSLISRRWSEAPELALGASLLLGMQFLWSLGLAWGLSPRAARIATRLLVLIGAVTAVLAIWYFYGRNPNLRAKFPYGNPTFLAACLIPGVVLALALSMEGLQRARRRPAWALLSAASGIAAGLMLWAFYLADSRGAMLGLVAGGAMLVLLVLRGRWRWLAGIAAGALVVAGGWYFIASTSGVADPQGRDASLRFRLHAWSYALRMAADRPLMGHGQGSYVLKGDSYVPDDILRDPEAFQGRLDHVHNEWLEVLADLGVVGLTLIAASLVLTFAAGLRTVDAADAPQVQERSYPSIREVDWPLCGALASLVGLIVDATFGVGLRVSGVPTWFYTLLGLAWAMSGRRPMALIDHVAWTRASRLVASAAVGAAGLLAVVLSQQDFAAARTSFTMDRRLAEGAAEEAVELAASTTNRLSVQRGLTALFRLAEAHMLAARKIQERAIDRETRLAEADPIEATRLRQFADMDRKACAAHCAAASAVLKELVARAPGFLNHGRVEYEVNMILADNAAAERDEQRFQLCMRNAHAAIERELRRQPFNVGVAHAFVGTAGDKVSVDESVVALVRPLRFDILGSLHLEALAAMVEMPEFEGELFRLVEQAQATAVPAEGAPGRESDQGGPSVGASRGAADAESPESRRPSLWTEWAPEVLRLAGALRFFQGDYDAAAALQQRAIELYHARGITTLGWVAGHAELADSLFYADPTATESVRQATERALAAAPPSLHGRRLARAVEERSITYDLAADREDRARETLRRLAPSGVPEPLLDQELGRFYRALCESLLRRREAVVLRKPASELLPRLKRWIARSRELDPDDPVTHYLSADLAFFEGDDAAAVESLELSLERGLAPEAALKFVTIALDRRPDSAPMAAFRERLRALDPPPQETPPAADDESAPEDSGSPD